MKKIIFPMILILAPIGLFAEKSALTLGLGYGVGQTTFRYFQPKTDNSEGSNINGPSTIASNYGAHPYYSSLGVSNGFNITLGGRYNFAKQGKLGFTYGLFYNFFAQNYGKYAGATINIDMTTPMKLMVPYDEQIRYYSHFYGFYLGGVWNFWQREGSLAGIYFNVLIGGQSSLSKYNFWVKKAILSQRETYSYSITNYQMALEGGLRYKLSHFSEFQAGLRVFFLPQNIVKTSVAKSTNSNYIQVYPNYAFNINYIMNFNVSK